MDIDWLNDRIDRLRDLKSALARLEEEAQELDVELDAGEITKELGVCEGMAALYYEADRQALRRAYKKMVL